MPTASRGCVRHMGLFTLMAMLASLPFSRMTAQSTNSSVSGVVRDPSGAVIPQAKVTLTAAATGVLREVNTGSDGLYRFGNLQPGQYELRGSATGFGEFIQKDIVLSATESATLNIELPLATAQQKIEVRATSLLNMENATRSEGISPAVLAELPLAVSGSSRSAVAFVTLLPGVNTGSGNNAFETRINGGMKMGDEATLDGVSMQEGLMSQTGVVAMHSDYPISPEAISEVNVLTSTYEPQYGSTTSGVITAVTKYGTNEFHGDLREYHHNTVFNARQFGAPERPKDIENQFGGSIGGPIKLPRGWLGPNRPYFFFNYERWTIRGGTRFPIVSIPSLKERAGDFSDWVDSDGNLIPVFDPATTKANPAYNPDQAVGPSNLPFLRDQFMGCDGRTPNVICPADPRLQTSLAKQWFKFMPQPTFAGALNNYVSPIAASDISGSGTDYRQNFDVRLDDYLGEKDHFTVTLHYHDTVFQKVSTLPAQLSTDGYLLPDGGEIGPWANRVSWDHIFSPTIVNTFNYGFMNMRGSEIAVDTPYVDELPKIPGVAAYKAPPQINFSSGFLSMGSDLLHHEARPTHIVNDLVTWVKGKHTLKFGGELRLLQNNFTDNNDQSGIFGFSDLSTGLLGINSGNSIASFLLQQVDSGSASFNTVTSMNARGKFWALHFGDTWKVTPKLSLTFGLRWDVSTPSDELDNNFSFLDPVGPNPSAGNVRGRLAFAGNKWGAASFGARHPENTFYKAFSPRFGFAYGFNAKTVVRGGYGIFYNQAFYPGWNSGIAQDGFNTSPVFASTNGGLDPAFVLSDGLPQTFQQPPFVDSGYLNGLDGPIYRPSDANRLAYAQQWNLTVERQLGNIQVSAAYVANKGTRLPSTVAAINALDPKYLSLGQKLYDEFEPGQTELDGVPAPYPGWVDQMRACAPNVAQALRPFPQYCGSLQGVNENAGNSTYHSFQLKVEQKYSNGLWLLGSYTFAKLITSAEYVQSTSLIGGAAGVISPFERQRNKALSIDDVPHTFSGSLLYDLPFGNQKRFFNHGGFSNAIFGGWQVATIVRLSSGTPYFFRSSNCNVPDQFALRCIPAQIPGVDPYLQDPNDYDPGKGPLFNRAAFEDPNSFNFYYGKGPRVSNLRGPRFKDQQFSLIKNTRVTERVGLRFQAEFFNIWNNHYFVCSTRCFGDTAFDTDVASPSFGMWNGNVSTPRNMQLALKLLF